MPLIEFTDRGLYCRAGDFYIDPWEPVERAVITHGHSDHARPGNSHYLCHPHTEPILRARLGITQCQTLGWNSPLRINDVEVTLFPAGHIIGSSQVRITCKGEVWVISGDYKTEDDGLSGAFEPVRCHTFITESTFGLPIFNWKPQDQVFRNILNWIRHNQESGKTSVLIAYSLGKAQRVLHALREFNGSVFAHGAVWNMQQTMLEAGLFTPDHFPVVTRVTPDTPREVFRGSVVLAPPSADGSAWMRRFSPASVGICSGWMQVRGNQRRRNADGGFALSDHCDWKGLLKSVEATGAERVFVTHGFQSALSRYLNEAGIEAGEVRTAYGDDDESMGEPADKHSEGIDTVTEQGDNVIGEEQTFDE